VLFSKFKRRKIEAGFDGGDVSSDGGLLLLREVDRKLGLLKAVAQTLPDPRNPALVQHTSEHLLRQRVFGICQGYEDLNDHDVVRDDLALQTALGRGTGRFLGKHPDAVKADVARAVDNLPAGDQYIEHAGDEATILTVAAFQRLLKKGGKKSLR